MWITFAAAGGLIAIPLLIHLFNRTRYRKVQWAAMEFLLAAYKKTRKRMQFEHLLLLLLRIMAMAFLAFAFVPDGVNAAARWALDTVGISLADATQSGRPRHLILVVDDTYSLKYQQLKDTNFDASKKISRGLITQLQEGRDSVTILLASRVAGGSGALVAEGDEEEANRELERLNREIPVLDVRRANEYLSGAEASFSSADFLRVLREAGRRIASIDTAREVPSLAVVSDFQNNQWGFTRSGDPQHQAYLEMMDAIRKSVDEGQGVLSFHDINTGDLKNRAILDVTLENGVIGPGIRPTVRITVGNFANGDARALPANFSLRYRVGAQGEWTSVRVPTEVKAGTTFVLTQELPPFQEIGTHEVFFELEEDALEEDNSRTLVVEVTESIPVLIVDGYALARKDADGKRRDGVDIFRIGLSINQGTGEDAGRVTPLDVVVADATDLSTISFDKKRVVVVANLGRITEDFVKQLERFVAEGNSVLFSLGADVNIEEFNTLLWKEGKGLLPARLSGWRQAPPGKLYSMLGYDLDPGSPLEYFGEREAYSQMLETPRVIRQWVGLETPQALGLVDEGVTKSRVVLNVNVTDATDDSATGNDVEEDEDSEAVQVDALNSSNSPLLVERRYGRGRVLVWATTLNAEWTALWSADSTGGSVTLGLPLYLFQEIVRKIASGTQASRNIQIGESFVRVLNKDEQRAAGYEIIGPEGASYSPVTTPLADERRRITFGSTWRPGVYAFRGLTTNDQGETVPDYEERFAVNLPAQESNVQRLASEVPGAGTTEGNPSEVIQSALKSAGIDVSFEAQASATDEAASAAASARREDVWMLFLGLAALCLVLEVGVSVWFGSKPE